MRGEPGTPPHIEADSPAHSRGNTGAGAHVPAATMWPMVFAAGITLLLFGVVTGAGFSLLGFVVLIAGVAGWIRELRDG